MGRPTEINRLPSKLRYILMPVVMLVKCEKCGYENFPQHRYCGMCASPLRIPGVPAPASPSRLWRNPATTCAARRAEIRERPATPAKEAALRQVSGPSFLGLGQEPAEDKSFSYLFEDETPSHTRAECDSDFIDCRRSGGSYLALATRFAGRNRPAAGYPAGCAETCCLEQNGRDFSRASPSRLDAREPLRPVVPALHPNPLLLFLALQRKQRQTPPPAAPDAAAGPPAGSGTDESTQAGPEAQTPNQPRRRVHQVRLLPMRNRKNRTPMKLRARRRMRANLRSRRQHGLRQRHLERTIWRRRARNISMETVSRRTALAQEQT